MSCDKSHCGCVCQICLKARQQRRGRRRHCEQHNRGCHWKCPNYQTRTK